MLENICIFLTHENMIEKYSKIENTAHEKSQPKELSQTINQTYKF